MPNYTVYHLHTENSLLDSCTNFKLYVDKAKELGQTSICFTEHGNIYNWIAKKMYCEEQGIKYLHGVECYLTRELYEYPEIPDETYEGLLGCDEAESQQAINNMLESGKKKIRDNYHSILIARNYAGLQEINSLIDASTQEDHFYYKPRITFDEFKHISNNVIKISACLASPLNKLRDESLIQYYDYLEVQPHVNSEEQKEYNVWLYEMSKKYNKPLIAGTDTHSLNAYKAECRSILQLSKHITFTNEDQFDLTYKSYDELVDMFKRQNALPESVYLEAIKNTNVMADSVNEFELDKTFKYAKCYDNDEAVLKQRINEKYRDKIRRGIIKQDERYVKNVREEFRVFKKLGMLGFMLFMSDIVSWCWENNIPVGYCRGSVGGSTIAYLTDIIDVDPIKWNTVFSRFANEDREELGDIDIDLSPTQRHLVYEHIIDKFGADYTAYILAIGTISDKGTIDDIGRALSCKWVSDNKGKNPKDNPYSLDNIARIKQEYDQNPDATKKQYPDIFYYFDGLVNTAISQSMHPAGIIVSPVTLYNNYGTFWADGKRILQINMEECHEVSLVKYDLLGLKNVEIIKDTCNFANIPYPKSHEINWEDENVWNDLITSPAGIFQFEGSYAFRLLKSFAPHKIIDLSLCNASLRPSGESYRDNLLARKINHNPSEIIDELLKDNLGYLVFQEDTIAFLQQICGLSGSEADNIRRAIGRKQKDRLDKAMPSILEGYCKKSNKPRNIAEQEAKAFLQIIEDSASYQFGYNHSTGYSMIGYTCAYLRYYYPHEFIAAYLNNANNDDDILNGTKLAMSKGIKIYSPKFRHSKALYQPDKTMNAVYKGLASIKYLNSSIGDLLYKMRDETFENFFDFLTRIQNEPINSRQLDILIKLDFFSEFGEINTLLKQVELFNKFNGKKQMKKSDAEKLGFTNEFMESISQSSTEKMYKGFDWRKLIKYASDHTTYPKTTLIEKFKFESEFLGYISLTLPDTSSGDSYYIVQDVNTKYSPRITAYDLSAGTVKVMKMYKRDYENHPVQKGDLIQAHIQQRNKSRKVGDKWEKIPDEFDDWIVSLVTIPDGQEIG